MKRTLRIIGLGNEIPSGTTKPLIIPFGAYPHSGGKVVQLVNAKTAATMVADFAAQKARPGFKGLPIYIGHPDVKAYFDKYRDHRAYGWIVDMYANESALVLVPEWTEPGTELLSNEAFGYFSPNWLAWQKGTDKAEPFRVVSVGLTQTPMIEYLALANEGEGEDQPITEKEQGMNLLERLKALINRESVQTDDDVVGFVQKMIEGFKALRESQQARWKAEDAAYMALENEDPVAGLVAYIAALETARLAELALANEAVPLNVQSTLDQLTAELELANEELQTLRKQHSVLLLEAALAAGKITPATRAKWEGRFAADGADFMALANELASIDPVMKTARATAGLNPDAGSKKTHADLRVESIALANEKGIGYESAYAAVKSRPEFAHLSTSGQADAQ